MSRSVANPDADWSIAVIDRSSAPRFTSGWIKAPGRLLTRTKAYESTVAVMSAR